MDFARLGRGSVLRARLVIAVIGIVAVIGLAAAAMALVGSSGRTAQRGMGAGGTLPPGDRPGSRVDVAVVVRSITAAGAFDAAVLDKLAGETYRVGGVSIAVRWTRQVPVAVGDPGQIKQGAATQVRGVTVRPGLIDAQQLTVLTGVIRLQAR